MVPCCAWCKYRVFDISMFDGKEERVCCASKGYEGRRRNVNDYDLCDNFEPVDDWMLRKKVNKL